MAKTRALKKRYILCEIKSDLPEAQLKKALYDEALKFFGEYLLSFVALKWVEYNADKKTAVLRCSRDFYNETLGFLALLSQLNRRNARVVAKKGSGTIKALTAKGKSA